MRRRKGPPHGRNQRPAQALPAPRPQTPFEREDATKRCGEVSELAFALAAARHRFGVSRPYGDSERYDLILDCHRCYPPDLGPLTTYLDPRFRPRLIRVQVKATTQMQSGVYRVNAHRRIHGRAVPYKLSEIDFFAAYVIPLDAWYLIPAALLLGTRRRTMAALSPVVTPAKKASYRYECYREAWNLLTKSRTELAHCAR